MAVTQNQVSQNSNKNSSLLRGALKIEASTSTPDITVGTEFSIYVVIRNPFPVPVTIYSTETHIPVELSDEIWRQQEKNKRYQGFHRNLARFPIKIFSLNGIDNAFQRLIIKSDFWTSELTKFLWRDGGPRVAIAVSPLTLKEKEEDLTKNVEVRDVQLSGEHNTLRIVQGSDWNLNFAGMSDEEIRKVFWDINEYVRGGQPITLNPGNSVIQHFILKTMRWITFTPISHTFQIQVRYELDGLKQIDTLPFALVIRAPIKSSMAGAIIGSIFGYFVSAQAELDAGLSQDLIIGLVRTIIFALIIIIALNSMRKQRDKGYLAVCSVFGTWLSCCLLNRSRFLHLVTLAVRLIILRIVFLRSSASDHAAIWADINL